MPPFISNKSLSLRLVWHNSRIKLKFTGNCLKQEDRTAYTPNNVVNLSIVYELDRWSQELNAKFTLKDCFFGNVNISKTANPNKYSYSGYGVGFDSCSFCHYFWS